MLSQKIVELQGTRQGGVPSPDLFKARDDNLLNVIEGSDLGYCIGSVDCSIPTCADEKTLCASTQLNLQSMINIAENEANRERYTNSQTKSAAMVFKDSHLWEN